MLKPLEVYGKKFDKSFRGYEEEKVDAFLLQVAKDFEALYEENIQLKEDAELTGSRLEHYQQLEKTMQNTLMIAQTTAEEIKAKAEREREEIIGQARERANQILSEIEANAQNRKDELAREIEDKQRELAYVQTNVQTCLDKMKSLLENQLRILGEDDFAREMAHVTVDADFLKAKEQPPAEETIAAEEGQEIAEAMQLETVSEAEEISDMVPSLLDENKSE